MRGAVASRTVQWDDESALLRVACLEAATGTLRLFRHFSKLDNHDRDLHVRLMRQPTIPGGASGP